MNVDDLMKRNYTITLHRDDEGDWVARIPALQGLAAHGVTEAEALAHLRQMQRAWFEMSLEHNLSIPDPAPERLREVELFGWIGEDEYGSGKVGIKAALAPSGYIPLVAVKRSKVEQFARQMLAQATAYRKRIYLCRFVFGGIVTDTNTGEQL